VSILFIGEPGEIRVSVASDLLDRQATDVLQCCYRDAVPLLAEADPDLIIAGVETSDQAEFVDRLLSDKSLEKRPALIVLARKPSGGQVLNWLRGGATAVELWPCQSARIEFLVDYLTVGRRQMTHHRIDRDAPQAAAQNSDPIIMTSPLMRQLVGQIERIGRLDVNVLLTGETGVGKTRLAQLLHDHSNRQDAPFVAVNCGALPENLLESELFGHRRGAFTGAEANRIGRFEEVGRGTLFLDEVDSIPIGSQCKLLRAVENRLFEPLGSNKSVRFRGRLVAASNAPLERLIEEGKFRADLFYRLSVVELYIPPLRERREDIRSIAEATLLAYAERNRLPVQSFSEEVLSLFENHDWPGNIRQLKNLVESSASLCMGQQITLSDLSAHWIAELQESSSRQPVRGYSEPQHVPSASANVSHRIDTGTLAESRAKLEADRIRNVLRTVGNNRSKAAIELGISRTMLYKKLAKYGLAKTG
jgi:two-component system nitrogen regulation response regulator GlnG